MVQTSDSSATGQSGNCIATHTVNINPLRESNNALSTDGNKKRLISKTEKILSASLVFTISLLLLLISLILLFVLRDKCWSSSSSSTSSSLSSVYDQSAQPSTSSSSWSYSPHDACLTPVCVTSAAEIMNRIDLSVDPCDDFYKYSCGGMDNKLNPIPDDKSSMSTSSLLQLEIDKKIRVLISEINETDETHYLAKMKLIYDKCMNINEHEALGDEPLKNVFDEIGGWPVVTGTQWNDNNFTLEDTFTKLKSIGYEHDYFAKIEVAPYVLAHKFNLIYVGIADLGLDDRSYYLDPLHNDTLNAYLKFMIQAAIDLGSTYTREQIKQQMSDVITFEKEIAQLILPRDSQAGAHYYMNLSMIQEIGPYINWTHYLNGVFGPYIYVPDDAYMIVKNPNFIGNITNLIKSKEPRLLANYIGWRVILESTNILHDKWSLMARKLWVNIDGRPKLRTKWKYCLSTVKKYFELGTSALYVQSLKGKDDDQAKLVRQIVGSIKDAFLLTLRDNTWMDNETKEEAINKTNQMKLHVGYPRELLNDTAVNSFYELMTVSSNWTFFTNTLLLRRFDIDRKYMKVQFSNEKGHWHEYGKVIDVNAYYRAQENSIEFPLSIVEAMKIHKDKPMFLNYGDIGWVVGHEIIHGFDNMGKHFDGEGNLRSWWSNDTDEEYEKRTTCFVKQYESYDIPDSDQSINGNLTLGENIADNGGIREAFRAYLTYKNTNGPEKRLPGLTLTPDQLFFVKSASFYCGKHRKELTDYSLKTDGHSPNMYRVIGSLSNFDEFAKTFNCAVGSRMNPVDRCTLW